MSILQSIFLGFIQGAAEFLPISSSGHLTIFQSFMDIEVPLLYNILLHVATLVPIIIIFRKIIGKMIVGVWNSISGKGGDSDKAYMRAFLVLLLATAVTVGLGFAIKEINIDRYPKIVACLFLVTALVLFLSKGRGKDRSYGSLNWKDGLFLGAAQGLATLSGISRSGMTISASLFRGLDRKTAGEFSFLMSIPVILGAMIVDLGEGSELAAAASPAAIIAGMVSAFVFGFIALLILLKLIKGGKLHYFCFYLVPFAIISFILV